MKVFAPALFLLTSFFTVNSVAQVQTPPPPYGDYQYHLPGLDDPRRDNRRSLLRFGLTPEPRVMQKGPLAPSVEDRTAYASFLKNSGTGLVRLLPPPTPADKQTTTPKFSGGGQRYSFSFLSHNYLADVALTFEVVCQGGGGPSKCQYPRKLSAGSYGMLTNLGDVALDQISVKDPRAAFLLAYKPPREGSKVRCEWLEFSKGVTTNGQLYKNGLPIQVNSTYLLRSTDRWFSDVLVAFRVVREDVDGSVTLAWKLLKEFKPRRIENVLDINTAICPAS
jgi:hypothetical protein